MPHRTPSHHDCAGGAAGGQLSTELAAAVATARRRAARDGDRHIDTAHLLHSLLESDETARTVLDSGSAHVARVLGYLVQRSIGYGLRWHGAVEDSGALPVVADGLAPGWSPAAATAMAGALQRARARGPGRAEGLDLLAALTADPRCRAAEVLDRAGADRAELAARLEHASQRQG